MPGFEFNQGNGNEFCFTGVEETQFSFTSDSVAVSGLLVRQDIGSLETVVDGNPISNDTFAYQPVSGSTVALKVNGLEYLPADGESYVPVSAFYVTSSEGEVRRRGRCEVGDVFRWNGSVAGYQIDTDDVLTIEYQTRSANSW